MAILFSSDIDAPEPWRAVLAQEFPDLDFRVWPDAGDVSQIRYALIWKIEPGALNALPNLQAVLALGAGVDQILADPAFPKAVPLLRLVDAGLKEQMSEYGVFGTLYFHRNMGTYLDQQRRQVWQMHPAVHPAERRVGVMGLGVLGGDLAGKLAALGFRTLGWSRTAKPLDGVRCFAGDAGFDDFLAASEILINLLPLTPATREILNADLFAKLPRGAVAINMGRGGHLAEDDLIPALDSGQLGGAMLDVVAHEPLAAGHPFWSHPKIVVTPHVACQPIAELAKAQVIANIRRLENGEPPTGRVDPDLGY